MTSMTPETLRDLALSALEDTKGIDIATFDVRAKTAITDYMIICTGRSNRQTSALAEAVSIAAKRAHAAVVRVEGDAEGEWLIVDLGDVVVHVMLAGTRANYNLEQLWGSVEALRG